MPANFAKLHVGPGFNSIVSSVVSQGQRPAPQNRGRDGSVAIFRSVVAAAWMTIDLAPA